MYEQETDSVMVRARPSFLEEESAPKDARFVWAYTITIENRGAGAVQLLSRYWRIMDAHGLAHEVRGEGVVGEQPVIEPGSSFTYTSAAPLTTASGLMMGAYTMTRLADGHGFDVAVPAFALDSPYQSKLAN